MELVDLTQYLVNEILPDVEVEVKALDNEGINVIEVLVPEEYMSKIIGKGGCIANSIRTLVQASAYVKKLGKVKINIDVK